MDIISYSAFRSHLASPKNAERLSHSIAELEAGTGIQRELIEE